MRALEIDPRNAAAHYNLGAARRRGGQPDAGADVTIATFLNVRRRVASRRWSTRCGKRIDALGEWSEDRDSRFQIPDSVFFPHVRRRKIQRFPRSFTRIASSSPPRVPRQRRSSRDAAVYEEAERDPEAFWAKFASELEWSRKWTQVLDWSNPPHAKWFVGGQINVSVNCVDRHIRTARRNKAALIWEGEPGDRRTLTYFDLYRQVSAFANVLKSLGVKKGDRVAIYMPLVPELAIAMLACARIGAPHSIVFGGFSAESLRDRINDAQCKVLITADGGYRRGSVVPLKKVADEAIEGTPSVEHVIVLQRLAAGSPRPRAATPKSQAPRARLARADGEGAARMPGRADGLGRSSLHPLHVGHDRQAEGHHAHDRRLSDRRVCDDEVGLRSEGRRCLLVHRRHRLGDRPQLRRLRAAGERRDGRDVRRRARLSAERSLVGNRRALRRDDFLHRADRDSRVHEMGHRLAEAAQHVEPAPARIGRRAHQSRGVDLVPHSSSAASGARSSTRGGRPKRA